VNFITATTLARHILRSSGFKPKPFTFGVSTIVAQARRHSPCIIVGSFEGGEIDALIEAGVRAAVLGKIHDRKYNTDRVRRIGSVTLYPVPKTDRYRGFEYLAALVAYFDVANEEVKFFEAMISRKDVLAKVLTVTNAWIPAYDVFTTFEVIDDPKPDDVDRVLEYLKKRHGYESIYRRILDEVKSNIVADRGDVVAIYLGANDPRRYMVVAQETYRDRKAVVLVSEVSSAKIYKLLVICNKRCSNEVKEMVSEALSADCRGGTKRFTVRASIEHDLRRVIEAVVNVMT